MAQGLDLPADVREKPSTTMRHLFSRANRSTDQDRYESADRLQPDRREIRLCRLRIANSSKTHCRSKPGPAQQKNPASTKSPLGARLCGMGATGRWRCPTRVGETGATLVDLTLVAE